MFYIFCQGQAFETKNGNKNKKCIFVKHFLSMSQAFFVIRAKTYLNACKKISLFLLNMKKFCFSWTKTTSLKDTTLVTN